MSDGNNLPRPLSIDPVIPPIGPAPQRAEELAANLQKLPAPPPSDAEQVARKRIASLEREAKALSPDAGAAVLFHRIGLLWEEPLKNPRNAAVAYQNAFRLAPKFLANLRAARRLFSEVGNWQMVVQLLDAELDAVSDERERASLLLEKGIVLEECLSRQDEAAAAFEMCLQLRPQDLSVLVQLESLYAAAGQYPHLVEVYRLLGAAVNDESARAYYLTAAGLILEARLGKREDAAAAYEEAFKLNRRDPVLLAALVRMAERGGQGDELIAALAAQAQAEPSTASANYLRISRVYAKLGRPSEALCALLDARNHAPADPIVLSELAFVYGERGMNEELAEVLIARSELSSDENEFAGINLRLAALYEELLHRDEDAVGRYRAVLARIPHHAGALAGLGRLYHRRQNWDGLLSVFDLEVAAAEDPRQKAARMYKAAEILEKQIRREEEAIARYNQCLQLEPGYLPAQQALSRLYERQGRYGDLVAMYEQEIAQTSDRDQVVSTLNKMAVIYEERLSEIDRAIDCMHRILDLVPDHLPSVRNLARMLEYAGRWRELIRVHEQEATASGDTKHVVSLHHRNAEILEEQLGDRAGAIAAYQRLLSLSPAYLPALKALGRLYAEEGNWAQLVEMFRAEAEIAASPEQASTLLFRAGELIERKLGDEAQAVAAYREVLELSPTYVPALRALEQIYRSRKDWEQLVEVLRAEAATRSDPLERANALFQAGDIWEAQLERPDQASAAYVEVLRLVPGHAAAIAALERLYGAQGNLKELVAIIDREAQTSTGASSRIAAYLKLAQIYLDQLNEPGRAAQACEAILAMDAGNLYALKILERAKASDRARRSEIRLALSQEVEDERLQAALMLAALSDGLAADPVSLQQLLDAFAQDPLDSQLHLHVERALRRAGDYRGLVNIYLKMVQIAADPTEKTGLLFRIADLAEFRLSDPAAALAAYRSALELNPQLLPAFQGLSRSALQLGDYRTAREALESEGRVSRDVRGALEAFVAAGRLCADQLRDAEGAIANFRRALERDPLDPAASAALEPLLAGGKAEDLAAFHERAAEAKLAQKDLPGAGAEFLIAARTWLEKATDAARALRAVERSLAAQPSNAEALELKGNLALQAHQFGEAAAAYAARLQAGGEATSLIPIHLKLGALYQDHLADATRAAAHFQTVLEAEPRNPEALERLAGVHSASRNWTGAADCLKELLEIESQPSALARHSLALAKIYEEGFSNPSLASSLYRRALEVAPGDLWIVGRLIDLYERMGNVSELVQMLEQQAQHGGDAKRYAALRVKIGDLYSKSLGDPQKAVASYRLALERDPACLVAHVALADTYMRDAAAAPNAIEAHRQLLRLDPTRAESLHALFRLWEGLGQLDRAYCAASALRFQRAANDAETRFYLNASARSDAVAVQCLEDAQLEAMLHPDARGPLLDVVSAIGDQLAKIYPIDFEKLGINRKADRLKSDQPAFKSLELAARIIGVDEFEAYQAPRAGAWAEIGDPFVVCVSAEASTTFGPREQRFSAAKALFSIRTKTAIAHKLSTPALADLIGAAIRMFAPQFQLLGAPKEELARQLARSCSRRSRKALAAAVQGIGEHSTLELEPWIAALTYSADRAGLVACGDVGPALSVALDEEETDGEWTAAEVASAVRQRPRLEQLLTFALSDAHFQLREKLGIAI
jgi:tetratricopeptide (TPR) repeat protein